MKFFGLFNFIILSFLSTFLVFNGVNCSRLRRALFNPVMNNPATNIVQSPFPWFGPLPSQSGFPFANFPSADQMRQQIQDYISAMAQQMKDQQAASTANCSPSETKTETFESNGRKYNRTVTTCVSSGPNSVASVVSSSTIPLK